jgi:hypothetical protein
MIKKKNILKYIMNDQAHPEIRPAKFFIPDWYKEAKPAPVSFKDIVELPMPLGFKACSPFLEALSTGYIVPLPVDIAIRQTPDGPHITWTKDVDYLSRRGNGLNETLPTPHGFSKNHYTWITHSMIKIPKGYSALFTHPLNRYDLPFLTLSGVVDGEFTMPNGNVPVFFSNTFEGLIPAGTPMFQVILFKTENWESEQDKDIMDHGLAMQRRSENYAYGWYRKNILKRKIYN